MAQDSDVFILTARNPAHPVLISPEIGLGFMLTLLLGTLHRLHQSLIAFQKRRISMVILPRAWYLSGLDVLESLLN